MTKIIVLFNLKDSVSVEDYEVFARNTDLPIVNALPSVKKFEVLKAQGTFSGGPSPYQYIEIIDVHALDQLGSDVSTEAMKKVAAQFQSMAENPQFIITEVL